MTILSWHCSNPFRPPRKWLKVLNAMAADSRIHDAAAPTLFHPDLHKRNIFISEHDPSGITGNVKWHSSSIEPAFWYTDQVPDFAIYSPSPASSSQPVDDNELYAKAYDVLYPVSHTQTCSASFDGRELVATFPVLLSNLERWRCGLST